MPEFSTVYSYVGSIKSRISLLQHVEGFFHLQGYEESK